MTDDRHARVLRGRDAIAAVLTTRLGLDAETAQHVGNNIATALGGCVPGDEIAEGVMVSLQRAGVPVDAARVCFVLEAWVCAERPA